MVERQRLTGPTGFHRRDLQRVGARKPGLAADHGHIAAAGQLAKTAGEGRDYLVLPSSEGVDIYGWSLQVDAPLLHLPRLSQHPTHVQQGLRRNAASQQAGAAEAFVPFHQGYRHAEVGRHECRGIPARTAAQHHQWNMHRSVFS